MVDFVTALGRLLQSGPLRDAFAADPGAVMRQIGVRERDCASLLQLVPADLEFQAGVLLRKRFDLISRALPRTCQALGRAGWEEFRRYGRESWPAPKAQLAEDGFGFCQYLRRVRPDVVCPIEYHRVRFVRGHGRCAIRFFKMVPFNRGFRPGVQLFLRGRSNRWHEWLVYAGG